MKSLLKKPPKKQRTPEEIIGNDKLVQLLFEGYLVVPAWDHWFKPMCGKSLKGPVTFNYEWDDGASGGITMPSEAAERKIIESAQAVIFHAMSKGHSKLTLSATRSNGDRKPEDPFSDSD